MGLGELRDWPHGNGCHGHDGEGLVEQDESRGGGEGQGEKE